VEEKQQVAEIDPNIYIDDLSDPDTDGLDEESSICVICEEAGADDQGPRMAIKCDCCERFAHIFCTGMDSVPSHWTCNNCLARPFESLEQTRRNARSRMVRSVRENRATQSRRRPVRPRSNSTHEWARIWQQINRRTHIDVDFPFDDDEEIEEEDQISHQQRIHNQGRNFNRIDARLRIASRQGARSRFLPAAQAMYHQEQEPPKSNETGESQEELRAWNAFEKARQAAEGPDQPQTNRRKRKSPTPALREETPPREPERALKRPRTKRLQDTATANLSSNGESSRASAVARGRHRSPVSHSSPPDSNDERPSFLKSLLQEVECKGDEGVRSPQELAPFVTERGSSRMSSPASSPAASNHPTPRAGTPPPLSISRPASPPIGNASYLYPVYPQAPEYSPTTSPVDVERRSRSQLRRPTTRQPEVSSPRQISPVRASDNSPTRSSVSFETKMEVQQMVSAALKPIYHEGKITTKEYTDINQSISRGLYDRVGDAAVLADADTKSKFNDIAKEEVDDAVKRLIADRKVPLPPPPPPPALIEQKEEDEESGHIKTMQKAVAVVDGTS
jgi:hypothetical protein